MTIDTCRQWRGSLAGRALGVRDPDHDIGLDAHLEGCADCRAELEDLRAVASAVLLADPERVGNAPVAPPLADRIVAQVANEASLSRRRRRRRIVLGTAAVVATVTLVAASLIAIVDPRDGDRARPVQLAGGSGVEGTAVLTERSWGTEVALEVSGLDRGEVYWLWLSDADGDRSVAGSFTGTGAPAQLDLASALPLRDARRIWMTDGDDSVVLDALIG